MVYVFLANGFEETEAICPIDIMLRAGIEVELISVSDDLTVNGAHGIDIKADKRINEISLSRDDLELIMLPGGMPGTNHLMAHEGLKQLLCDYNNKKKYLAAICAAPSVLGQHGLLKGRHATCYPGFEEKLLGAEAMPDAVVMDGHIITSRGMGTAISFGAALVSVFAGEETAEELLKAIQY